MAISSKPTYLDLTLRQTCEGGGLPGARIQAAALPACWTDFTNFSKSALT
jgi:hypothetical protein